MHLLCVFYHPLLKSLASNNRNFHTQPTQPFSTDVRVWLEKKKKPQTPEISTLLDFSQQVKTLSFPVWWGWLSNGIPGAAASAQKGNENTKPLFTVCQNQLPAFPHGACLSWILNLTAMLQPFWSLQTFFPSSELKLNQRLLPTHLAISPLNPWRKPTIKCKMRFLILPKNTELPEACNDKFCLGESFFKRVKHMQTIGYTGRKDAGTHTGHWHSTPSCRSSNDSQPLPWKYFSSMNDRSRTVWKKSQSFVPEITVLSYSNPEGSSKALS